MKIESMTKAQFASELIERVQGGASESDIMYLLDQWEKREK